MQRKRKLSGGHDGSGGTTSVPMTLPKSGQMRLGAAVRIVLPRDIIPPQPRSYPESALSTLDAALQDITSSPTGQIRGHQRLFLTVQNLCILKHAEETYQRMQNHFKKHCHDQLQTLHESIAVDPLQALHAVWSTHCCQVRTISSVYIFLDRTLSKPGLIATMGRDVFRTELLSGAAWSRTIRALMDRIRDERNGIAHMDDNVSLVKDTVAMTCDLNLYSVVEAEFCCQTNEFYSAEGTAMCSSADLDIVQYLEHIRARLHQETTRVGSYFQSQTLLPILHAVEKKLVANHLQTIIQCGFARLMSLLPATLPSLALLFQLALRIKGHDRIKRALHDYVIVSCNRILQPVEIADDEPAFIGQDDSVSQIGAFKDNIDSAIQEAGELAADLQHSCKDAFEAVFKTRGNLPAELLSRHIDWLLHGHADLQDDELEARLDRCMVIFKFIHGKDMFEAFYKTALAQRLLLNESCSTQAEINMISKLRVECGALFTSKLEGMLKDMDLSSELGRDYPGLSSESIVFRPAVLTIAHWPSLRATTTTTMALPTTISRFQTSFEQFYSNRHSGRKLCWVYEQSSALLKGNFPLGRKELIVSTYQAMVLMAFNTGPDIQSYAMMKEKTQIDEVMLKHALGSLCSLKARILKKRKKGPVVDVDEFQVNKGFTHDNYRLSLFSRPTESRAKADEAGAQVISDRIYQIDAILVRHMKAVKSCTQAQLIAYCIEQCDFPVPIDQIHKRIGSLLDREYVERDSANSTTFRYVA